MIIITCIAALSQPVSLDTEFRIIPAGRFNAIDGRPGNGEYWNLSEESGLRMVAEAASRNQDYVIDFEHQSTKGVTAPAAGWFNTLSWKPDGLYVKLARWTDTAKAMIKAKEYRFISPEFCYSMSTKEVTSLKSIALTNNPALTNLTDLFNVALTRQMEAKGVVDNMALENISKLLCVPLSALKEAAISNMKEKQVSGADENTALLILAKQLNIPIATLTAAKAQHVSEQKKMASAPMSGRTLEMFTRCFPGVNPNP